MNSLSKYLIFFFVLLTSNAGLGQLFNFQQISIHEGLPQSQAFDICFDSTDHVWIATQGGGLCRYNGVNFSYFTKRDSLISDRVFKVFEQDGHIYVGQKGGVSKLSIKGQFIKNYRFNNPSMICQDIMAQDQHLLLATNSGLYQIYNDELSFVEDNPSLRELNIYRFFKADSNIWCCTNKGLVHLNDPVKKMNRARGLSRDQVQCAVSFDDKWFIGTYGSGIEVYDYSEGELIAQPFPELEDHIILDLFVYSANEIWIATLNNGVYMYSKTSGELKNYRTNNGLPNNHVKKIVSDAWGNVWIGTSGGGVAIYQNSPFVAYDRNVGLNGNYVFSVINARNNQLWCSTEGGGVVRLNDTSSVLFDEEYGFVSQKAKALFEDNEGDIWIGTEGEGVGIYSQYDGLDTIYRYTTSTGLAANWIKGFAQAEGNNTEILIATYGAGIIEAKKGVNYPFDVSFKKIEGVPDRISSLSFHEGKFWFTSPSGDFGYLQEDNIVTFGKGQNVFRNIVIQDNYVWLGSTDNGVLRVEIIEDTIRSEKWLNADNGLSSNNIYQLKFTAGNLWVGTERGLDRLRLDNDKEVIQVDHFGVEEGFEGVETNVNAAYIDRDLKLWSGTVDGLFVYQGGEINYSQNKEPRLFMKDFSIFYESIESTAYSHFYDNGRIKADLLLPYNQNHIGFSFYAIHYTSAKNIRYRWKLDGADRDWTPPSTNTTATYSNLAPGKYTFSLQAGIDGNWSDETIQLSFEIDQPYYQKIWFKAMYFTVIGLIILLVILMIIIRLKRKNRALREKLEIEKNLIELEQKALRLQMNPHFIFNVLTSIHNLIILQDTDKARYALSKFSKLMRRVLENSREKLISIDDEIETLENYVQLEKLTSNLDVDLKIDLDEEIDAAEALLPPLMIQPFVENAIIHGLKELDHPGVIKVGFRLIHDHLLECYVEDNGRGRAKAASINAQKENYHKSTALQVTQERLSNLNKKTDFLPFEIIDLKNNNGQPSGTKVVFRLQI